MNRPIAIILLLLFLPAALESQEKNSLLTGEYSARNIYSFTLHLARKGEYYRAHNELLRLKSYYPAYLPVMQFSVMESFLLIKGGQYDTLLERADRFPEYTSPPLVFFTLDAGLASSRFDMARSLLGHSDRVADDPFSAMFFRRKVLLSCLTGDLQALDTGGPVPADMDMSAYNELVARAREGHEALKSPAIAALAGVMPGMGYAYSGNTNTGLVALVVVSLTAALTWSAFHFNNRVAGVFIGAVGTFFYTGSIVGGWMNTVQYNRTVRERMKNDLIIQAGLDKDQDMLLEKYGPVPHE